MFAVLFATSSAFAAAPSCKFTAGYAPSCVDFDLCGMSKLAPVVLNDSYPEPYLVAPPLSGAHSAIAFGGALAAHKGCTAAMTGANAYQFEPVGSPPRCIALTSAKPTPTVQLIVPGDAKGGVKVTYGGGVGGRDMIHVIKCAPGKPLAPVAMSGSPYTATWEGDAGCGKPSSSSCPEAPPLAKPTAKQMDWQEMEIGALIHFNMMTTGSCNVDPSAFNPTKLDTDQWVESFAAFGVKEAVLVAKHGCGYVTWPSAAKLPDGTNYNYSVAHSSWEGGKGDVLAAFKKSCLAKKIGVGYYYSLGSNGYTTRLKLTSKQLEVVEMEQMTELWTKYGNDGDLTEIWFDGGIEGDARANIRAMLAKSQPNAQAFNGCVVKGGAPQNKSTCITPNSLRWIGTEAGTAPDPNWSTGFNKGGDPTSDTFCPAEADTTLQNGDQWFYDKKVGVRTLAELQDVYHGTVGHNSFLMMDYAPTPEGLIAPDQVAAYKGFGDWQKTCYEGKGLVGKTEHARGSQPGEGRPELLVQFAAPMVIDRVVVREDQTDGQAIRGWSVQAQMSGSAAWTVIANGTSIGNKWITLLPLNYTVTALKAVITASAAPPAKLRSVSGHLCPRSGKTKQCSIRKDWLANGVGGKAAKGNLELGQCCAACMAQKGCAFFTLQSGGMPGIGKCTLFTASSAGGKTVKGAYTGSPPAR